MNYEEMPFDTAPELVTDIVLDLGRSEDSELHEAAMSFAERMFEEPGFDHSPTVTAASCVYFASLMVNGKVTQPEVARAAGCNDQSIRSCYIKVARVHDVEVGKEKESGGMDRNSVVQRAIRMFRGGSA